MRIKIEFETQNDELPIDYRRKFISFIKSTLEDYNQDLYFALYGVGHTPKSFCFGIYFVPNVTIDKEGITLHSKQFNVTFTTIDVLMGVHLVNAFMTRRNKWFPLADSKNKIKAISISKVKEYSISSSSAYFQILSPIIIRDHDESQDKDWYLTYEDGNFEAIWKRNLVTELRSVLGRDVTNDINALQIKPIHLKKTVIRSYGIFIPCTIGSLIIKGENYLLEYLYKAGIGSKRSMGYGCVDVMRGGM